MVSVVMRECKIHHNKILSNTLNDETNGIELIYLILQELCEHTVTFENQDQCNNVWEAALPKMNSILNKGALFPKSPLEITTELGLTASLKNFSLRHLLVHFCYQSQSISHIVFLSIAKCI